jgi:hypothetical protein
LRILRADHTSHFVRTVVDAADLPAALRRASRRPVLHDGVVVGEHQWGWSLYGKSADSSREPYMLARAEKCSRERVLLASLKPLRGPLFCSREQI